MKEKQYTLEELKLGIRVKTSQLSNIYDTYILMKDVEDSKNSKGYYTTEGTIVFIGHEQNKDYAKAYKDNTVDGWTPGVFIQRHDVIDGVY